MDRVSFTKMKDGTKEDYDFLTEHETEYTKGTAHRLLTAMVDLNKGLSGYQVTRLGHSLQSATRAWRDRADTDWVVAALLHDIGDIYAPYNHDEYAASILKPFVREQCTWCVQTHGDFQMVYYAHHVGADPEKRSKHKGSPYFDDCAAFCERWDQASFDPAYDTLPLEFFAPMVEEVFARKPYDPAVIRTGAREPLTGTSRS
ncbi:HD domain-containing protein [Roseovarius sp. LXJ103]|uniref:HD domain-containing protein n=1 Tax=Roseovarius carneus TaxID=2853164 RepID=UPI000D6108CD|nr:inositol oxygenase family protein [Roseovarius carneus]MBZ8117198.1 HD domain-containing protein [Roseovarius carneus]PWE36965.1 peptidase [Pelagicola sp. LXJ1103]